MTSGWAPAALSLAKLWSGGVRRHNSHDRTRTNRYVTARCLLRELRTATWTHSRAVQEAVVSGRA